QERHLKVMGQPTDFWVSPIVYASCQMLEQAISRHGTDREAVTADLASGTFQTIIGDIKLENNQLKDLWLVGQWQSGRFVGISPAGREGAASAILPKPAW